MDIAVAAVVAAVVAAGVAIEQDVLPDHSSAARFSMPYSLLRFVWLLVLMLVW